MRANRCVGGGLSHHAIDTAALFQLYGDTLGDLRFLVADIFQIDWNFRHLCHLLLFSLAKFLISIVVRSGFIFFFSRLLFSDSSIHAILAAICLCFYHLLCILGITNIFRNDFSIWSGWICGKKLVGLERFILFKLSKKVLGEFVWLRVRLFL